MSYKIYPITPTHLSHDGYQIKINGVSVSANTARVSAFPFNRRWPGHQRSLDQTELINFLSLETDEPLTFEITPKMPFENVVIRPTTLGITPEVKDGKIIFTLPTASYFTVEPYGRTNALHIFADPISNYTISQVDKNVLYFGKGEHDIGHIELKSNQTLFIDEGAVVYACVHAIDAENIKIVGRGILDNSRNKETILYEANEKNNSVAIPNAQRLHTIQFEYCTNITIEGITIRDSLVYNIRPIGCHNLNIKNVKIIGCWRYNSDGIDMHNCVDVEISNCFLRTFDDSICVKGFDCFYDGDIEKAVHNAMYCNGKSYDVFKNVRVSDCVIWNDWGKCLEIGAETRAEEIFNILFENCHIIHVTSSVLSCQNVDYADIHDVEYKNISIELDPIIPMSVIQESDNHKYENPDPHFCPEIINVGVSFHEEYSAGGAKRGKNHDILFENIKIHGNKKTSFYFSGYDSEHQVSNITIKSIFINGIPLAPDSYTVNQNKFCENISVII